MGFENDNGEISLKLSHGNEIRRITLQGTSFAVLLRTTAELFSLDVASIVLKYQDEDDDKVTMSSDAEVQEAIRVAKRMNKVLRLFVEARLVQPQVPVAPVPPAPSAPAPAPIPPVPEPVRAPGPAPGSLPSHGEPDLYFGPGGSRFGFPPRGYPHYSVPPMFNHGQFGPSTPFGHHPHHPPHHPPGFHFGGGPGFHGEKHYGPEHHRGFHHRRHGEWYGFPPRHFNQGTFTPVEGGAQTAELKQALQDKYKKYKETKRAMKESWKEMEREASTEEDKKALKELKHQMKSEMRQAKSDLISEMRHDKDTLKALHLSEKWKEGKEWKKEKKEKKEKEFKEKKEEWKDRKEWKEWKREKKEKKDRYVARHVEDVTIPDGTELPPNTPFLKTWKIRNEGPAWPNGCQLLFVSHKGDNLNGPERVVIKGDVLPGQEVEVSVPLITPAEPGRYVGYYRMVTPDGIKFGQRVWVSFVVKRDGDVPMGAEVINVEK